MATETFSPRSTRTFVLRCGVYADDAMVGLWELGVFDDSLGLACRVCRWDAGMWWELKEGEMRFKDNKGNFYSAVYQNGWWRARVPKEKVLSGSEFWPCELVEGSGQYVNSCEVGKKGVPSNYPWPEPEIEEEPEGVVTPFAILGDEDDRPIEEVVEEFKGLVKEATKEPLEVESDSVVETGLPPLDIGPLHGPITSKVKEEPLEAEPELEWEPPEPPKPKKPSRKKRGSKRPSGRKRGFVCPVCGISTTKGGKLFASPRSVVIHARMVHGERLKEADIKKG